MRDFFVQCSCPLPLQPQNLSGAVHLLDCLLLSATFAAAESVGCCLPARTGQNPANQTRRLCSRRICRVLPTCSTVRSCPLPLQPQNLSGAAYLLDRPLLPATVAAAESVGCCLPVRTGQSPAAHTAAPCLSCRPLLPATFAGAESVGCCLPVRTGQNPAAHTAAPRRCF